MTADLPAGDVGRGPVQATGWLRWFFPGLTLLLAALAVGQFLYLVPYSVFVVQRYGAVMPWHLRLAWLTPEWAVLTVALVVVAAALWLRRSVPRTALFAAGVLLFNVVILLSICVTQVQLLRALGN